MRRYFIKHPSEVDLEKLDQEEVDKEMAADEATQSSAAKTDAPDTDSAAADARICYLEIRISFFFFFWVPIVFVGFL